VGILLIVLWVSYWLYCEDLTDRIVGILLRGRAPGEAWLHKRAGDRRSRPPTVASLWPCSL